MGCNSGALSSGAGKAWRTTQEIVYRPMLESFRDYDKAVNWERKGGLEEILLGRDYSARRGVEGCSNRDVLDAEQGMNATVSEANVYCSGFDVV